MLIKLLGLEVRTGKDRDTASPRGPQAREAEFEEVDDAEDKGYRYPKMALSGPDVEAQPKMNQGEWGQATQGESQSLALVGRKPHAYTRKIQWPAVPDHPLDQTHLSILMNETDHWFRELQKINICPLDKYIRQEGIILYGKAREAYDILHSLHCVGFHQIHPAVLKSIPAMYSCILSGGEDNFNYEGSGWK